MGISVFPAPSAGISVSDGNTAGWGRTGENWVLLGRSTANASSYNFTSLNGYKKLKINVARAEINASTQFRMQINGDSGTNYSQADARRVVNYTGIVYIQATMQDTYLRLLRSASNGGAIPYITTYIDNADSTVGAKHITTDSINNDNDFNNYMWSLNQGHWNNLSAITSINLYAITGTVNLTGSSGFIEVWGCN